MPILTSQSRVLASPTRILVRFAEIPGNGVDDDSNGYVDDYLGYNFAYNDADPMDDHGHSTACAGIVAGAGDNGFQLAGVAYQCQIMCVKIGLSNGYSYVRACGDLRHEHGGEGAEHQLFQRRPDPCPARHNRLCVEPWLVPERCARARRLR